MNAYEQLKALSDPSPKIVVANPRWGPQYFPESLTQTVLDPDLLRPFLEKFVIETDHNTFEVPPIYAWTKTHVHFVTCYYGETWLNSVPRRPEKCKPRISERGD